ncbi:MAG: hypothetical protein SFY32_06540 [Bacteroidota bacterium]|nr:hypothetical protein [Bacteroidota bacterium]
MKYIIFYLFTFFIILNSNAQLVDVLQVHAGTAVFPQNPDNDPITFKPKNLYAGFGPGQIIGVAASKFLTDKFILSAEAEVMRTNKPNYGLLTAKVGGSIKYNIIAPDVYRFSPYLKLGGNAMFITISQGTFDSENNTGDEYPKNSAQYVQVDKITNREQSFTLYNAPVLGGFISAGLDVNVWDKYSIFGEYQYNYNLAKSSTLIQEYFPYNKSDFVFQSFIAGLRVYMY